MSQSEKELIKHISINDCLKEVDLSYIKGLKQVFIICQDSFTNKNVDIHKFVIKQYTKKQLRSIIQNGIKFDFTCNEIISLNKNKKDFYIVDYSFLSNFGINNISSNILYYLENSKKFLYFINEGKLLKIESRNLLSLMPNVNDNKIYNEFINNNNKITNYDYNSINNINDNKNLELFYSVSEINGNINRNKNPKGNVYNNLNNFNLGNINNTTNEININNNTTSKDKKTNILNALILIYASDREYSRIVNNNLPEKYDLQNFCLIN